MIDLLIVGLNTRIEMRIKFHAKYSTQKKKAKITSIKLRQQNPEFYFDKPCVWLVHLQIFK